MNEERHPRRTIVLCSIFFVIYLFVAAFPLQRELELDPRWVVSAAPSKVAAAPSGSGRFVPFRIGSSFGYVREDGSVAASLELPPLSLTFDGAADSSSRAVLAIADDAYAVYAPGAEVVEAKAPDGGTVFRSREAGIPFFQGNRHFFALPGMDAIGEYRPDGSAAWIYEFPQIVTAFDSTPELAVAGLLNGGVEGIDRAGNKSFSFETGGSRIPVVYGLAVAPDGNAVALVCGLDGQRFMYLERKGAEFRVAKHRALESTYRYPVSVRFSASGRYVYFAQPSGICVFDVERGTYGTLPISAPRFELFGEDERGFVILSAEMDGARRVACVEPPARVILAHTLPSDVSFVSLRGESLYLGIDGRIARMDYREE